MLQKSKSKKVWKLKYLLLIPMVLGMLFYTSCKTQSNTIKKENIKVSNVSSEGYKENEVPFGKVEEVPTFPGCEDTKDKKSCFNEMMLSHINENFSYPLEAQKAGIQGRVAVLFTITEEGLIDNVRKRGPDKLLEDEVERIIKLLPKMIPGKNKSKAVDVAYSIPIDFKLQ